MNTSVAPPGEPPTEQPKGLLIGVLVLVGLLFLPWFLLAFTVLLSVTPTDEPVIWFCAMSYLPVVALCAIPLFVGFHRNKKSWMVVAGILPTISVAGAWAAAIFIDVNG